MNERQVREMAMLEHDVTGKYGCLIVLMAFVWGIVIVAVKLPKLIAGLTFHFLAHSPFNIILGILLWFLGMALIVWWCEHDETRRLKEIQGTE